ncbi:MAG: RluA family pseudouridine synthase [Firmicutes bacterium]|uniref:Pseudouridine synthase n=1 Tax=Candidatus Onthovivens merdipullorum TaxID=2840889 RepID=A0A9D9DLQ8_9BACL|nr:RluA family pseudouridine synthase [Candidatus Onthovivens merdipullorum]
MKVTNQYKISSNLVGLRIDRVLPILDTNYSRVYFSNAIKLGNVLVNGKETHASYKVNLDDEITVNHIKETISETIKPYECELNIVYEDDDILIINKPQGLVVHPGNGHENDTLVNALVYHHKQLSTINGLERVGIVHRIDKDTSGLLLICKNDNAHRFIAEQLLDHTMNREYIALVCGVISVDKGKIIAPLARCRDNRLKYEVNTVIGKEAITHFTVLKRFEKYTLIKCKLETGRTHQIRVHMEYINHPIVGDNLYGKNNCVLYSKGQLLHAYKLNFIHPSSKKEMSITCPIPEYFKNILINLK